MSKNLMRRTLVKPPPPRVRRWTESRRSVRRHVFAGLILVMGKGRMHHCGPKDEVLAKALPRPPGGPRPLQVVPDSGRSA